MSCGGTRTIAERRDNTLRWAFSCKVQEEIADFLVLYCYSGTDSEDHGDVEKILLIPKQFFNNMQSISVSCKRSKWYDFEVSEGELKRFFEDMTSQVL